MGFLELGKRSIGSRKSKQAPASQSVTDTQSSCPPDLTPTATFRTSLFERLPIEIHQRIFLFSYNPNLPLTNRFFLSILSSPYLISTIVSSAVRDEALSKREYKRILSEFLKRRFFTIEFLRTLEETLWENWYQTEFETTFPSASCINTYDKFDASMGSFGYIPYSENGYDSASDREDIEVQVHIPALERRMILRKLDLRTVTFPRDRLLNPPYTLEKMMLVAEIVARMPSFWADLVAGEAGKAWGAKMLEVAVRKRCAAMVHFLANYCHVAVEPSHLRAAAMPRNYGRTGWLEPEFSMGGSSTVGTQEDLEMAQVVQNMAWREEPGRDSNIRPMEIFFGMMGLWKNGKGELVRGGWGDHVPEIEDSARVLWVFAGLVERKGLHLNRLTGEPEFIEHFDEGSPPWLMGDRIDFLEGIAEAPLMADEKVWEAAMEEKGAYWRWLLRVGRPPAGLKGF